MVGTPNDLPYKYVHLGTNAMVLEEIANGTHAFAGRFKSAQTPMILAGVSAFERVDGEAISEALKKIALQSGVINNELGWNGYNILHRDVGRINALEVGITARRPTNPPKVVVLLGSDNNLDATLIPKDAYVIYIGHHGDEGAYYADMVLPAAAYTEKNGTFVCNSHPIIYRSQLKVECKSPN